MAALDEAKAAALVSIRAARAECESARGLAVERVRELDAQLRQLATAERALDPQVAAKPRQTSVDKVRAVMIDLGIATQSQVAKLIDSPKNTAKHALGVLASEGFVEPTGQFVGRSPQYKVKAVAS